MYEMSAGLLMSKNVRQSCLDRFLPLLFSHDATPAFQQWLWTHALLQYCSLLIPFWWFTPKKLTFKNIFLRLKVSKLYVVCNYVNKIFFFFFVITKRLVKFPNLSVQCTYNAMFVSCFFNMSWESGSQIRHLSLARDKNCGTFSLHK